MKHIHHIVPKHMGGTDNPDNLVELTVEEHAEAHRKLYEEFGKHQDYLAWKGLSGRIGKDEIIQELSALGGKRGAETCKEKKIGSFFGVNFEGCSKGGKVSANKGAVWWFNGTDYKFTITQPEGYVKSSAPNNPGKVTKGTYWWNNGMSCKRSVDCPGDGWIRGRM